MTYPVPAVGTRLTADFLTSMLEITVRKAGSTSRASTTVVTADPELLLAVEANAIYSVKIGIMYTALTAVSNGGISLTLTGPVGATGDFVASGKDTTTVTAGNNFDQTLYVALTSNVKFGGIVGNATTATSFDGTLSIGATSGSFTFTWAQAVSSATATVLLAGSFMQIKRIG